MIGRTLTRKVGTTMGRRTLSSSGEGSIVNADKSKSLNRIYHISGTALAVLTPVAFVLSPSPMNLPVDLALGVMFPLHAHIGMNYVISDYVPKATRGLARGSLLAFSVITAAGLLRLNVQGAGLTDTVKSVWRTKKE
jgi:succinate dehydrogenase (ubiquinone) membrane anchor subunit